MGPFTQWPTGSGFEYFYGFIGGETNQYYPAIYEGTTPVEPATTPGGGLPLHRGHDRQGHRLGPPAALAHGRPALLHVLRAGRHPRPPPGPDRVRRQVQGPLRRRLGRRAGGDLRPPEGARGHPRRRRAHGPAEQIPAYDDMPDELKPVLARQMEIYAGFLDHTDHHVGRLIDTLEDMDVLDGHARLLHHRRQRSVGRGPDQRHLQRDAQPQRGRGLGDRRSSWPPTSTTSAGPRPTTTTRWAGPTPCARPTSGPSRSPRTGAGPATAPSCTGPTASPAKGEVRDQFHHVIDLAPTVLEAAGIAEPTFVNGIQQQPIEGVSMLYTFADPDGAERRETQYFEMFCNRGIYHRGWTAVTRHSTPWDMSAPMPGFDDDSLGALRHQHRLDPGPRPVRRAPRQAP